MDVHTPHAAPASIFSPATSQTSSRSEQEGIRRDSRESGQSFSSELRKARASKEPRQAVGRIRAGQKDHLEEHEERDAMTSPDDATAPASASLPSTRSRQDKRSSDNTSDPEPQKTDTLAAPAANDVATQSVLLALIAQPVVATDMLEPAPTVSTEQVTTAMESVMPSVKEDVPSLPVAAADSSAIPAIGADTSSPQTGDATSVSRMTTSIPQFVAPSPSQVTASQEQPISGLAIPAVQDDHPLDPQTKPALPLEQKEQPHKPVQAESIPQAVAGQNEQPVDASPVHDVVKTIPAAPLQRLEENRPLATEKPVLKVDASAPKDDLAQSQASESPVARQAFADQKRESAMDWSGQDHRERPSSDQGLAHIATPEIPGPAATPAPLIPAHTIDPRALSPAPPPSAKLPVEAPPGVTLSAPPVQPTDWMPGNTTSQTKSMTLELSQEDLGRVNIRVAVNQDVVHTHFASDRSDMGQYLQNGQDKLQSALQMSGLDLGRFQVDIDRQSAGRSFQQSTSQEQPHGRSPRGDGQDHGQERAGFSRETEPRRGMLNLVA